MSERLLTTRLCAVAAVTVGLVVACDRVPLTSPTGSTIALSIDRSILPLNGQAMVRAVVTESAGTPVHNGTTETFQSSIGRTDPVEAQTVNGVATVTFLAGGTSGSGFIHAFSGGARTGSGNASSGGVEVRIGAAAAGGMSVSATPPSISQSGGTVTISALVMDPSNNPLPGVSVLFSASLGTLGATTAISDANGIARTTFTTAQTATVTAIAGAAKGEVVVTVSTAPIVTITAPDTTVVGVPVAITITPQAAAGTTVPRQIQTVVVAFGDGSSQTLTNITGAVGLTKTYNSAGGFTITATATDVTGNTGISSKAIVVTRQQLPTVSLTAPATTTTTVATAITFSAAATTPAQIVSARVTLQDGTVIYNGTGASNFAYRFGGAGTYTLTGSATDSNGNTATTTTSIVVTP